MRISPVSFTRYNQNNNQQTKKSQNFGRFENIWAEVNVPVSNSKPGEKELFDYLKASRLLVIKYKDGQSYAAKDPEELERHPRREQVARVLQHYRDYAEKYSSEFLPSYKLCRKDPDYVYNLDNIGDVADLIYDISCAEQQDDPKYSWDITIESMKKRQAEDEKEPGKGSYDWFDVIDKGYKY